VPEPARRLRRVGCLLTAVVYEQLELLSRPDTLKGRRNLRLAGPRPVEPRARPRRHAGSSHAPAPEQPRPNRTTTSIRRPKITTPQAGT